MFPIAIRSNIECPISAIREFAEHRIRFALDRFRDLRRIVVSIADVNGPKGGPDKACQIVAEFGFANVIIREVQPEWQRSLARAVDRLARQAARELAKVNRSSFRSSQRVSVRTARANKDAPDML